MVETTAATSVRHATYLLLLSVELLSSFNVIPYTFSYFIRSGFKAMPRQANFPASFTFMYAPIIHIFHPSWQPLYSVWIVIGTMCSLLLLVQETLLSPRHRSGRIAAKQKECLSWPSGSIVWQKRSRILWKSVLLYLLHHQWQLSPVRSQGDTAITPPPSLHLIPNVLHDSCVWTPQQQSPLPPTPKFLSLRLKYLSLQVCPKARQSTNSIKSDQFKYRVGSVWKSSLVTGKRP